MRRVRSSGGISDEGDGAEASPASAPGNNLARSRNTSYESSLEERAGRHRLLVVANRLPYTATRDPSSKDGWKLKGSAGGLVSALMGIHQSFEVVRFGWPGIYVGPGPDRDKLEDALHRRGCIPVWIDPEMFELYYNGYSNNVLWPLFHYVPMPVESRLADTNSVQQQYLAYTKVNKMFADCILDVYSTGDIVWLHDYHLLMLSQFLKDVEPGMKVGWFLHTPFPSSEIYRTLPLREEILKSLLRNDLVGFHTYDYARHFVSACTRILACEGTPEGVEDGTSVTRVAAFPIGIDPDRFTQALETDVVKKHMHELRQRFGSRKIMLGVDRLDMIKGIPQKLLGFERFLESHPEWRDRVLLVQIAVPTRQDVPEYQKLASQVHEIVGRINGRFGSLGSLPINHLDRSLGFEELCALYAVTDVLLVTSLRDGMNLVSYEYVACQSSNAGVLVLSEFAGAAQSLGAGAILVNPWSVIEMAGAIEHALTMSDAERRERHRQNFMHVTIHTAQAWADTFISELNDTHVERELRTRKIPPPMHAPDVVSAFSQSKHRLLVFGFNATLTTVSEAPRRIKQQFEQIKALTKLHPDAFACLKRLCAAENTSVCVFSGSERSRLEEAFSDLPDLWLAAENGVFVRPPILPGERSAEWSTAVDVGNLDWLESVQLVFDYFAERTPRSFVETRETSLVWNYKYADPEFGHLQARDLLQHMVTGPISNASVEVLQGAKSVEVRPVGVSKGTAIERIIKHITQDGLIPRPDFVLCAGHFLNKDEDLFTYLETNYSANGIIPPPDLEEVDVFATYPQDEKSSKAPSVSAEPVANHPFALFTCTVGRKASRARYFVNDADEVADMLLLMVDWLEGGPSWRPPRRINSGSSVLSDRAPEELP